MPPRYCMHDIDVYKLDSNETLEDIMIENHLPIPNERKDINKMSIFDKACFGEIPDI